MNTSNTGRIVPCCGISDLVSHESMTVSEISWPPLGIVFSYERHRYFDSMQEITDWGRFKFANRVDLNLSLPRFTVNTHYPIGFGTVEQIQSRGWVYLFHVPPESKSPTNISALIRRIQ